MREGYTIGSYNTYIILQDFLSLSLSLRLAEFPETPVAALHPSSFPTKKFAVSPGTPSARSRVRETAVIVVIVVVVAVTW